MKVLDELFKKSIESTVIGLSKCSDRDEMELLKLKLNAINLTGQRFVQEGLLSETVLKGE